MLFAEGLPCGSIKSGGAKLELANQELFTREKLYLYNILGTVSKEVVHVKQVCTSKLSAPESSP